MNPLLIYLEKFHARLFPCRQANVGDPAAKRALLSGWRESEHTQDELLDYWRHGHPIAWALNETDLVVDVDAPNEHRPDSKGLKSLAKLENLLGGSLSNVATEVKTGETGGSHFYLKVPPGLKLRKNVDELPGLDFKYFGGYVITAGSPHWLGGSYNFAISAELNNFPQPDCPQVLLDLLTRERVTRSKVSDAQISGKLLSQLLNCLDYGNYLDHGNWFPMFVASHQATGGSLDGLSVFDAWCAGDPKYAKRNIEYRWKTLDPTDESGITIGTLFGAVIDAGYADVVSMVRAAISFDDEPLDDADWFGDGFNDEPAYDESGLFEIEKPKPKKKPKRKKIKFDRTRDYEVNDRVIKQLAKVPNLFQRANMLVTIADNEILPLNHLGVCEQISTVVELGVDKEIKTGDMKGEWEWRPEQIPERMGKQITARNSWFGIRRLNSVTTIPVMTSDGILQKEGYDAASCVFYRKTISIKPVRDPTRSDALEALKSLFTVVQDFPFASDPHRSAWLASLLAVLARPAINGPVPMTFIDGNQRGVGKGLLTDLVYLILFGANMPKHASMPKDESEMGKTLLSIAMRNRPTYNFDNVPTGSKIGSPSLDSVLTNGTVAGRILGRSEVCDYPIETVFFASGNRIGVDSKSDIIRRLNYVCLRSTEEKAENRDDFKIGGESELRKYVIENRADLIHAALTILEYSRLCDDEPKLKSWGSYEAFSKVVRRAIVLLGLPDPMLTRNDLESRDETRGELEIVIQALEAIGATSPESGMTAAEIITSLQGDVFDDDSPLLNQAKQLLSPRGTDNPIVRCGVRLSKTYRDQVCNGRWIKKQVDPSKKINVFWVEEIETTKGLF